MLAWFAVSAGANQVVVGIAFNLLMLGVTAFFFRLAFDAGTTAPRITAFAPIDFGALASIPILGPLLFQHDPLTYLTLLLVIVAFVVMHRSTIGLSIKAVGEHPEAGETLGLDVVAHPLPRGHGSGALAALGGAFLSTASTGLFLDNMTAGRGYIALAILILGRRHPFGILVAALLFGGAEALQLRAQLLPIGVPLQFLIMLPYVLTIVVLAGFAQRSGAPAALGCRSAARRLIWINAGFGDGMLISAAESQGDFHAARSRVVRQRRDRCVHPVRGDTGLGLAPVGPAQGLSPGAHKYQALWRFILPEFGPQCRCVIHRDDGDRLFHFQMPERR